MTRIRAAILACLAGTLLPAFAQPPSGPAVATADGRPIGLHSFLEGDFGIFEQSGSAEIEIRVPFDVRWVDVRPKSLGIVPTIAADHRAVRFRSPRPAPLTVEFNDDLSRVLHLFAHPPAAPAPASGDPKVIYFGPGRHEAGEIDLRSGQTLYLAAGAWVRGRVRCVEAHDVAIRGRGVLDGSDPRRWWTDPGAAASPARRGPLSVAEREAPYHLGQGDIVFLDRTRNVTIAGITLFDSPGWTVVVRRSAGVAIRGIAILNPAPHYGDDGIDIVSSSGVTVRDAFIRTNDDCIAVKNLDDRPMGDIAVERCVLWNMPAGGNGLEIGFENGRSPISGVRFRDIDLIHVERGAALSIHAGDSGAIEQVAYRGIRVEDVRRKLVDFAVVYSQYGYDQPASAAERRRRIDPGGVWDGAETFTPDAAPAVAAGRGCIRGVTVQGLAVVDGTLPYSIVAGFDAAHPAADVTLSGLSYRGVPLATPAAAKFVIANAPGFRWAK